MSRVLDLERLKKLEAEELRRIRLEIWRKDPLLWLEERLGENRSSFQWSALSDKYNDHVWDGDIDPLANAWKDVAMKKWVAISAATGTGKTFWLSRLVFWFLDVYEDSLIVTTAPAENQLKANLWGEISKEIETFKKIRPYVRLTSTMLKPEGNNFNNPYVPYLNSYMAKTFVAGVGANEASATKAQGFHRKDMLIICEEAAGMNPAMMTAFQNTCTGSNNIMVAVGNPDSELDQLNQFAELGNVNRYRISAYDYPNVVLQEEIFHGAVSQISIDRRKEKYGVDSPLYKSRVRGLTPSEGEDTLIKRTWIKEAFVSEMPQEFDRSYNAVGVDVANSELGDMASLAWGKRNVLTLVQEFQCPNASHLGHNLMKGSIELRMDNQQDFGTPTIHEYQIRSECIGIDAVGVGVSTVNTLLEYGIVPTALQGSQWKEVIPQEMTIRGGKEVPLLLYEFVSLRDQMYWELREDLRQGLIKFYITDPDMQEQILTELSIAKFMLAKHKVAVEGKDQIKKRIGGKSPNVADAIAYWNWVRKGHNIVGGLAAMRGGRTKHEKDEEDKPNRM